jgi:hypothetical protein
MNRSYTKTYSAPKATITVWKDDRAVAEVIQLTYTIGEPAYGGKRPITGEMEVTAIDRSYLGLTDTLLAHLEGLDITIEIRNDYGKDCTMRFIGVSFDDVDQNPIDFRAEYVTPWKPKEDVYASSNYPIDRPTL